MTSVLERFWNCLMKKFFYPSGIFRYVHIYLEDLFSQLYPFEFWLYLYILFFPHWGPKDPSGVQYRLYVHPTIHPSIHLYVCLSVSMYSCLCHFLAIICVVRNCAQRMQLEATGSNIPSGSIICPFFCPFGYTLDFFDFCIFIHFLCWV